MNQFNILVIEDDEVVAKNLAKKLNRNGFTAEYVLNGNDGLKKIAEHEHGYYDAVICDLVIPGIYGDKVFDKIQKMDENICFFMLTGQGNTNTAVKLMKKGACNYYTKPFKEEQYEEFFLDLRENIISKKIVLIEEKVLSTLYLNEIFDHLSEAVEIIFSLRKYCLAIIESEDGGPLKIEKQKGFDDNLIIHKKGYIKSTLEKKELFLVQEIDKNNYKEILPLSKKSKSLIAVPLIVLDDDYGILVIESDEPNSFTHLDKQTLKKFGNAVAIALHNNRNHKQKLEIIELKTKEKQYKEYIAAFNAMTHHLKTPQHMIQLAVSSLIDRIETKPIKDIREGLNEIYAYSENAEDMIRKVLLNYKDEEVETNLSVLFDMVRKNYKDIEGKGIIIEWSRDFLEFGFSCKVNQISFVIDTIIENAMYAIEESKMKDGRITIKSNKTNGKLKLEIKDNGPGIKKIYHDRVLSKIFSTKPDNIGNGIGLFLCKNFVEGHGGEIGFESEPGRTNFFFTLPFPNEKRQ